VQPSENTLQSGNLTSENTPFLDTAVHREHVGVKSVRLRQLHLKNTCKIKIYRSGTPMSKIRSTGRL
jgi:hypothetical protein